MVELVQLVVIDVTVAIPAMLDFAVAVGWPHELVAGMIVEMMELVDVDVVLVRGIADNSYNVGDDLNVESAHATAMMVMMVYPHGCFHAMELVLV